MKPGRHLPIHSATVSPTKVSNCAWHGDRSQPPTQPSHLLMYTDNLVPQCSPSFPCWRLKAMQEHGGLLPSRAAGEPGAQAPSRPSGPLDVCRFDTIASDQAYYHSITTLRVLLPLGLERSLPPESFTEPCCVSLYLCRIAQATRWTVLANLALDIPQQRRLQALFAILFRA